MNETQLHSIIQDCKSGRQQAYKLLYEEFAGYAFTLCVRYSVKEEDRKDLMQEIFAETFLKIDKYIPSRGEFKYWFRRLAINIILMDFRRKKDVKIIDINELSNVGVLEEEKAPQIDPAILHTAIENLPTGYQTIFKLSVIEGYDHAEISEFLGITPSSSRSQLTRAKRQLKKLLHPLTNTKFGKYERV